MPNKIKIIESVPLRVEGLDTLKFSPGTVFKVTHGSDDRANNCHVMRTSSNRHPFVTLENGSLWCAAVENYTFYPIEIKQILFEL